MLPYYAKDACESIDASFFSGDTFHDPEALAEVECYVRRWVRQIEVIKRARFYADDPDVMGRYEDAAARQEG